MALFKPEVKEKVSFSGMCECNIVGFEDKSADYEWADACINVSVKQKGSDYTRLLQIKGSIDKDASTGLVTGGDFFNRLYRFFKVINCDAGINIKGDWEDGSGEAIMDIADYLTGRFAVDEKAVTDFPYLGYFFKSQPRTPGGDSFNRAIGALVHNNNEGRAELQSDVDWRKQKGYLKEFDASAPIVDSVAAELDGLALGNM